MALIPPFFLDCVLAIGVKDSDGNTSWVGTGFLYGMRVQVEVAEASYAVYLVTNRHVTAMLRARNAFVRCNPTAGETFTDYVLGEFAPNGSPLWLEHPNPAIDVAVTKVDLELLLSQQMKVAFFADDAHAATIARMRDDLGVSEGDVVYVLGFPMGLATESNTVVARGGNIARIRDLLAGKSRTFLVDSQFFPGNSGGPVVSRPEAMSIQGTKSQSAAHLLGIAHSYVSYHDTAISTQTGRTRVVFEENSGLALAHPVDCIDDVISQALATNGLVRWTPSEAPPAA